MPRKGQEQAICAEVARLLREKREARGLSKYAVSQRSGLSQSMIGLVERGLRNPTLQTLLRIADALEIDLPALLKKAEASLSRKG